METKEPDSVPFYNRQTPPPDAGFCYGIDDERPALPWWQWALLGVGLLFVIVPWICGVLTMVRWVL